MKTPDLIALLTTDAVPVEQNATARRYGLALGGGAAGAMLMMLIQLGVRPDIAEAALLSMFWIKLAFVACIAASGLLAAARLSRPGAAAGLLAGGIGAVAYSFHCNEMATSFIGIWYPAGILLPVALGAVLGPRLLRW